IALLALVLFRTDLGKLWNVVSGASIFFLAIGILTVVLAVVVSAYKWQRLLSVQGVVAPLPKLFVFYLVGLFFNNFLPTNIGGDVMRIADVAKLSGKAAESTASVIAERLLAAFALALTAAIGLALSYNVSGAFRWWVVGIFGVTLSIILLFAIGRVREALGRRIKLPEKFAIRRRLGGVGSSMGACLRDRGNVAWVVFYSMVFQLTVVLVTYFIFLALGSHVPADIGLWRLFIYCVAFIPIISALQMLPISISGFGVREGAYVYFFGAVGIASETAIAASLLFWILVALVSLAGGAIFAVRK
ncbi:MAG: lysylphosphatidylglycerol synthase transmembrane domain-containing protein, partial [Dehalococcoidia bacterium]|nr:lysylphosphatidylglycerol synthase transmembrane domain-containing protein [Dehalococcoidia bacterium]